MLCKLFAVRVKSHINWKYQPDVDPWPIGAWVGEEDSEGGWGPRRTTTRSKFVGDANLWAFRAVAEKYLETLSQRYKHVEFEVVEFIETIR